MVRPDQSNVRNEILSSLSAEDFSRLSPHLQPVDLPFKQTLIVPDEPLRYVYFPDRGGFAQCWLFWRAEAPLRLA
jgi:hypothetical protein